jgi:hypothetical protein
MTRRQPLLAGGPRLVYFPGPASTDVGRTTRLPRASELFLDHHLGVVDLRIAFETQTTVTRWLSDKELTGLALGLVPDGYVEWTADGLTYCAFLEYDRGTEPLGRLEQKVRGYVELAMSGRFARTFQRKFFRTLFVTDTAGRLTTMRRAVAHVTDRIVRLTSRSLLIAQGPFAPIWARPGVDQALSFIHD